MIFTLAAMAVVVYANKFGKEQTRAMCTSWGWGIAQTFLGEEPAMLMAMVVLQRIVKGEPLARLGPECSQMLAGVACAKILARPAESHI